MHEEILDKMQELLKDEVKNFGGNFGKLEKAVIAMMMAFGERLYVAVNGTTAHETDGWHEVKVGSIYWGNERFERIRRYVRQTSETLAQGATPAEGRDG